MHIECEIPSHCLASSLALNATVDASATSEHKTKLFQKRTSSFLMSALLLLKNGKDGTYEGGYGWKRICSPESKFCVLNYTHEK